MHWQRTKAIVLNYVLGSGRDIKTFVYIQIIRLLIIELMQADCWQEWIFPNTLYFLVGTNMVHHCIAEFLTCPVNLEMLILFRDHFSDIPYRQRLKARRKLGFGFCIICHYYLIQVLFGCGLSQISPFFSNYQHLFQAAVWSVVTRFPASGCFNCHYYLF